MTKLTLLAQALLSSNNLADEKQAAKAIRALSATDLKACVDTIDLVSIAKTGNGEALKLCFGSSPALRDINAFVDTEGNTVLHVCANAGHMRSLRLLLELGASPMKQNNAKLVALDVVTTAKGHGCRRMLTEVTTSDFDVKSWIAKKDAATTRRRSRSSRTSTRSSTVSDDARIRANTTDSRKFVTLNDADATFSTRVVSYNILAQAYTRPSWFPWTKDLSFQSRFTRIEAMMKKLKADVYCLQEVDHPEAFEKAFSETHDFHFTKRTGSRKDGCVFLVKKGLSPVFKDVRLNDYVEDHRPQDIVAQIVTLTNGLVISNTHLYYKDAKLRTHDASILVKMIEALKPRASIMCGDWNFAMSTSSAEVVLNAGYSDSYKGSTSKEPFTTFASASKRGSRIDHIFTKNVTPVARFALPNVSMLLPNVQHGSDHIPIAVDV